MKGIWAKVWKIIRNKYVAATLIFLVIFFIASENNFLLVNKLSREVAALSKEERLLRQDITQDSLAAESLIGNIDAIETFGREQYYMKRANEDIFIIKD